MPREYPHLITVDNLLAMTGKQADCRAILAKLARHDRAVRKLRKAGYRYNSETGKITLGKSRGQASACPSAAPPPAP